jgi:hypothetical protein
MLAMRSFRLALVALATLAAGCFNPSFKDDIACGPQESCPSGLSCVDGVCRAGGGSSIDAPILDAPAPDAAVDATSVQCTRNEDCQNPTSRCQLPGECDLAAGVCNFGAVDCSSMNGECSTGVCEEATGACVAQPTNEDQLCGAGDACGAFGPCGNFSQDCDSSGTQTRSCTRNACQAGACVGTQRTDTAACARVTEGLDCGSDTAPVCASCSGFTEPCGESGSQTCTWTDFSCRSDACVGSPASRNQACLRDTDGASCGMATRTNCSDCAFGSDCGETGQQSCSCNTFSCGNGTCNRTTVSCNQTCTRDSDGLQCGCVACGINGRTQTITCVNGGCTGTGTCGFTCVLEALPDAE